MTEPTLKSIEDNTNDILGYYSRFKESEKTYNTLGGPTATEQMEDQIEMQNEPLFSMSGTSLLGRAAANTPVPNVVNWGVRKFDIEPDPNFDLADYAKELQDKYPARYLHNFADVRSEEELRFLQRDIDEELEDAQFLQASGGRGVAANLLAATVDPINYIPLSASYTGYKAARLASKVPGVTPRGAGIAYGAGAGLEATALSIGINELSSPTGDVAEAIPALAYGLAFGSVAGTMGAFDPLMKTSIKKFVDGYDPKEVPGANMSSDLDQTVHMPEGMASRMGGGTKLDTGPKTGADENLSAGAKVAPANVQDLQGKGLDSKDLDIVSDFRQFNADNQITDADMALKGHPIGNWLYNMTQKMGVMGVNPLVTSFDTGFNSGSDVLRGLTFMAMNSGAGIANNVMSVGYMADRMIGQIAGAPIQAYKREYKAWLAETGAKRNADSYRAFMREAQLHAHDIYQGAAGRSQSQAIQRLFDHEEYGAKAALDWMNDVKGGGRNPVKGAAEIDATPGWRPLRWSWSEMNRVGKQLGIDEVKLKKVLVKAITDGYKKMHPHMDKKDLQIWAKAVVRRAKALEQGVDTNLVRLLDQEGTDYVRQMLVDSGVAAERANLMIDHLRSIKPKENSPKIIQHRNEIDLRTPIGNTGYTLMDLTEFDQAATWMTYSRHASFAGARARWGLQQGDIKRLLEVADRELEAKGLAKLDDKYKAYFDRAMSGSALNEVNPWVRRMNMMSTLTLMNTQGLTQLADAGIAMGTVGFKTYISAARKEIRDAFKNKMDPALEQMARVNVAIKGEHHYIQPERFIEDISRTAHYQNEKTKFLDGLLVKGMKLQNMISGFEAVHMAQHRIVARSYIQNFGDYANGLKKLSDARLEDMGFFGSKGRQAYDRITKNFKKDSGIVEYGDDGNIVDLHVEKWNQDDWDMFMATQHHVGNQATLKLMRGEQSPWQSETFGYMISHLRSFTLGALQKQTIRHMRIMDATTAATALYSFLAAGTVYMAREAISGKEDKNLDTGDIVRGAFGLGSFTGGPAMGVDLLGAFLGIDALRVSQYRTYSSAGTQIVPEMVALNQMERLLHVPFSIFDVATGGWDKKDVNALQSLPIIGNLYGFTWMFNRMKHSVDEEKAEDKKAARKEVKETLPKIKTPDIPGLKLDDDKLESLNKLNEALGGDLTP